MIVGNDFWENSEYAQENYVGAPPTNEYIDSIEEELGYKLPASYIGMIRQQNGGIPVKKAFPTKESTSWAEDHMAIKGIYGIDRDRPCSVCGELGTQAMIDEWEYPPVGIAVCDTPEGGPSMVFLDYRECGKDGEPKVVLIEADLDNKIILLADNFELFIRGLVDEDAFGGV